MDETIDSILNSVKKLLGINPEEKDFDVDVLIQINSAISTLRQLGVGPSGGYTVSSEDDTFFSFLGEDVNETIINQVRLYLYLKVRLGFDPPTSSFVMECLKETIRECEWRLSVEIDPDDTFD